MPDVAFDSERHAQARCDIHDSGQELAASVVSVNVFAMVQMFGHWTTESTAQDMGKTARSFLTVFSPQMAYEAQFVDDMDVKADQMVADSEGTEEDTHAVMAVISTTLLLLSQEESTRKVYSQEIIDKLASENKPKDDAVQGDEYESEQQETSNAVGQAPSHDEPNSY